MEEKIVEKEQEVVEKKAVQQPIVKKNVVAPTPVPVTCVHPFNSSTMQNGDKITGYTSSSVAAGNTCTSGNITCVNGSLQ